MTNTLDRYIGSTAYDRAGNKIGKINQLYVDERSSQPLWVSVNTGLFGTSESLIPLAGSDIHDDKLMVAVEKQAVKDAPHFNTDRGVTQEQARELLEHYHLESPPDTRPGSNRDPEATAESRAESERLGTDAGGHESWGDPMAQHSPTTRDSAELTRSEERLNVGTERAEAGNARLVRHVVTEQKTVNVPVSHDEVRVEREPITDPHATHGDRELSDDAQEVTLHEDRIVVDRETVPVEKVRMDVDEVTEDTKVSEQVRKEQIEPEGVQRQNVRESER